MDQDILSELAPSGTLRAGINLSNFLLVTGRASSGDPIGVAPDMARAIADRLGVAVSYVTFASPGELTDAAGRDLWDIGLIAAEPARAETIAFSPPYVEIEATYMVPENSSLAAIDDIDRPGIRIAVSDRSAYDLYLTRHLKHAELVRAKGLAAAFELFVNEKLDALAGLRPGLIADADKLPGARILDGRFTAVRQAVGTATTNRAGAAFLADFVEESKASGLIARLIDRHGVTGRLLVAPENPPSPEDCGPEVNPQAQAAGDLQMSREQMLDLGQKALELVVGRIESLPGENAWEGEFRQVLEDQLLEDPPEDGKPAAEVIERAAREVLPFTLRNDHPRSFGFIPSSPTWPGVVADFMTAGYQINQCTWLVASGPSQLELVVIEWFRRWLGYPEGAGGLFTSGGSAASVDAFVAAREAAGHPERATVYMSDQSHSALSRAAFIVGIRRDCIRMIPSDPDFRMDMEALASAVAVDRDAGLSPIAVAANAGTTGTGAIDRLDELADFCAAEGLWLHVDAAYGGFAVVTERGKRLLRGIERADSIGLDAHKWFFQPYEAGCLLVKDESTLADAFAVRPDILQDTVWGANHPNFSNLGLQLSRSVRALKVWMSVQTFGMAAFRRAVETGMQLAETAEEYIRESPVLEATSTPTLGIVCFRVNPSDDELDEAVLDKVNRTVLARMFWDNPAFMSSMLLHGTFTLRMCIINHTTTWDDVRETLEAVERFGREALSKSDALDPRLGGV